MTRGNVQVVAIIVAKSDKVEPMRELLCSLVPPTRAEAGCRQYELLQNRATPAQFTFVEEWASEAALDAHLGSPHVREALARLHDLAAAPPDIRRFSLIAS